MVGIPKKSLEDYELLLKRAKSYINISNILDKKFGYIRQLVKMHHRASEGNAGAGKSKKIRKSKVRKGTANEGTAKAAW